MPKRPRSSKPLSVNGQFSHARNARHREGDFARNIEWTPVANLHASPHNARTHSARQIRQICKSIKEFGFTSPVLIDEKNQILAGHGRCSAAALLGWSEVPTLQLSHLSDAQKRAYIIADNQLAAKAGWDKEILQIELQALLHLDFDLELTGFEGGEIEMILSDGAAGGEHEDSVPETDDARVVTTTGDLWQLGDHLLICGDATEAGTYKALMDGKKAQFLFTDPPYNVKIAGNVSGLGAVKHREFKMGSGEMSPEQFVAFLRSAFILSTINTSNGSIHAVCMDWRHIGEMIEAGTGVFAELKNLCVWVKSNAGMGSFYRSRHELVFIWKNGHRPHVNNFELGQFGRSRSNVWEYEGVTSFRAGRAEELAMHPTCKPVEMIADAIMDCSNRNDLVLDPFGGSGSTLIAAQKTGRRSRIIELDPCYCDVIIRRWHGFGGQPAIHVRSGEAFLNIESRIRRQNEVTDAKQTTPARRRRSTLSAT